MEIVALEKLDPAQVADCARILREAFAASGGYGGPSEAEREIASFLPPGERFALAAVEGRRVLGLVGGIDTYSHAMELHPLVVDPPQQGRGIGAALVKALEAQAAARGKLAVYLGTDDEIGGTSLFGADIFPNALAKLAAIAPTTGHPFFFYQKLGYEPIGVIPDANGFGKPDLLMGRRIAKT
ncbi:MAG TPA: GNAT family N-acetyltransferase [Phenylobacterium sp.]|uniref:GNAT family N-acetyltransferase n=1 Tax=Phenylobacterium sp. TaxID=1871053 RepID=UPI002F945CFF